MSYDFLKKDDPKADESKVENAENEQLPLPEFQPTLDSPHNFENDFVVSTASSRLSFRSTRKMSDDEYHQRLLELNTNASNKHYVLFFGKPGAGKTFIIGSILHYMKNILGGMVYLDDEKSTDGERELFTLLQNRFNGELYSKKIPRTSKDEYFEFHIHFTPKDSAKPPIDIVFVDASGEHSENASFDRNNSESGELPQYLTVILESDVKSKLAFVYDKFLPVEATKSSQVSMLDQIFTKIQLLQRRQNKFFPKILLLAKSDRIEAEDGATVEKYAYSATQYAKGTIPSFANSFFNESGKNKAIFYKMGTFSNNNDLLLKFDHLCPAKLFAWLYEEGVEVALVNKPNCWQRFMAFMKGQ